MHITGYIGHYHINLHLTGLPCPCKVPQLHYAIAIAEKDKPMSLAVTITDLQKVKLTVHPDEPMPTFPTCVVTSGDSTVLPDDVDPMSFWLISGNTASDTVYTVTDGPLSDIVTLTVTIHPATTLGLTVDTPVLK